MSEASSLLEETRFYYRKLRQLSSSSIFSRSLPRVSWIFCVSWVSWKFRLLPSDTGVLPVPWDSVLPSVRTTPDPNLPGTPGPNLSGTPDVPFSTFALSTNGRDRRGSRGRLRRLRCRNPSEYLSLFLKQNNKNWKIFITCFQKNFLSHRFWPKNATKLSSIVKIS